MLYPKQEKDSGVAPSPTAGECTYTRSKQGPFGICIARMTSTGNAYVTVACIQSDPGWLPLGCCGTCSQGSAVHVATPPNRIGDIYSKE